MKQPKRKTKNMVLCADCKKPIHIEDIGLISKEGMFHKECIFRVLHTNKEFIEGYEVKVRKNAKAKKGVQKR